MRSFTVCCALVSLVACGGAVTTVDGNKSTTTLSPTDQDQLCNDTYNYAIKSFSGSDLAKLSCGFNGSGTGTDPSTCSQTYNTCVAQESATLTNLPPSTPNCQAFAAQVAKCNTTVSEYTKCLTEEIDAVKAMESQLPLCTTAARQSAELAAFSHISVDCLQLLQTCQVSFVPSTSTGGGFDAGTD